MFVDDRSAGRAAELVELERVLLGREHGLGVERVVAQELVGRAVQGVACRYLVTTLTTDALLRPNSAEKLFDENAELLDHVDVRVDGGAARP